MDMSRVKDFAKEIDELINNFQLSLRDDTVDKKCIQDFQNELNEISNQMKRQICIQEENIKRTQELLQEANASIDEVKIFYQKLNPEYSEEDSCEDPEQSQETKRDDVKVDIEYLLNCSFPRLHIDSPMADASNFSLSRMNEDIAEDVVQLPETEAPIQNRIEHLLNSSFPKFDA